MAVTPEEMKAWLDANPDKAGTEDFVRVTEDYKKATAPAAAPNGLGRMWNAIVQSAKVFGS